MRAFLGEKADHREVDYFQGMEQFREQGLHYQLPAAERDKLQDHPSSVNSSKKPSDFKARGAPSTITYRAALERETLCKYQKQWVQDRRVWKILT